MQDASMQNSRFYEISLTNQAFNVTTALAASSSKQAQHHERETPTLQNIAESTRLTALQRENEMTRRRITQSVLLAQQLTHRHDLGDPNFAEAFKLEAHAIHTTRAALHAQVCVICLDTYEAKDRVLVTHCHHHFHASCSDMWSTMRIPSGFAFPDCPMCRCEYKAVQIDAYTNIDLREDGVIFRETATPPPSPWGSAHSQAFPIWPARLGTTPVASSSETQINTRLPNGQLSIIPDTGACGDIVGAKIACEIVKAAQPNGANVTQEKLDKPYTGAGVGNGTQTCKFKLNVDLAIPRTDGTAEMHNWQPPIVAGTGEDLPGLLGLDSLEKNRAIIDTGKHIMIYPGPGEVQYILPLGSVTMPLTKNPNGGHLCLPVCEYAKAAQTQHQNKATIQLSSLRD